MSTHFLTPADRAPWAPAVRALGAHVRLPWGGDLLRIETGPDPFAAFDRLGELLYGVIDEGGSPVAAAGAVLRTLPLGDPANPRSWVEAWQVVDLKVRPDRRNTGLPLRLLTSALPKVLGRARKGFALAVTGPGQRSPALDSLPRLPFLSIRTGPVLDLFAVPPERFAEVRPALERARGKVGYLSLAGRRDLVSDTTGAALPIVHAQWGPLAARDATSEPPAGATVLLFAPEGDPLHGALTRAGALPVARAVPLAIGLDGFDWTNLLSSDV